MQSQQSPLKMLSLQRSRTEGAFSTDESLWWNREIQRIFELLRQHLNALTLASSVGGQRGQRREDRLPVLSIAVLGDHGSGKSSLLRTLAASFREGQRDLQDEDAIQKIHCLPVLKPNPQDKNDHLLYALLAAALRDDAKLQGDQATSILTALQSEVQEVSEYLQVVDPAGPGQENDPLGVSLERLDRHSSSLLLNKKMDVLIKAMARLLAGDSLVLMPVDDADATMRSFAQVLDTCQRYLFHPKLVPIIAFNPQLAEDFLVMHFFGDMVRGADKYATMEIYGLAKTRALQDLAKLFPERSRIHLRPEAVARVLATQYAVGGVEGKDEKRLKVLELLSKASGLLFGSYPTHEEGVRKPLRPSSLRRQLQIVDAMDAVGVGKYAYQFSQGNGIQYPKRWIEFFDEAAWTLIDLYRDVLRELVSNLDDILGWTPIILRTTLLNCILSLDLTTRRTLLNSWLFSSDDLRSQVLSLLAVTVFRPRMAKEPPWGDNTKLIAAMDRSENGAQSAANGTDAPQYGLDLNKDEAWVLAKRSFLWFLHLSMGFYLPQLLVRDRSFDSSEPGSVPSLSGYRVSGIGWQYDGAASRAARQALANRDTFSTGMLLVGPGPIGDLLRAASSEKDEESAKILFLHIWCFYGLHHGVPWAAVSLWRGLGLIGRILAENEGLDDQKSEADRMEIFREILLEHIRDARIAGSCHWDTQKREEKDHCCCFKRWLPEEKGDDVVSKLAEELVQWLRPQKDDYRSPGPKACDETRQRIVRRMHGDSIVRRFWLELDRAYAELSDENWNALEAIGHWTEVLRRYWSDPVTETSSKVAVPEIVGLLDMCPIPLDPCFYKATRKEKKEEKSLLKKCKGLQEMLSDWKRADSRTTPFDQQSAAKRVTNAC